MKRVPRVCGVLAFAVAACAFFAAPAMAGSGGSYSVPLIGTPPTLDGAVGSMEWASADTFTATFGALQGTVYVGRDSTDLYLAISVPNSGATGPGSSAFYFDNNDNGVTEIGDDIKGLNSGGSFLDYYALDGNFSSTSDAADGGATDGAAAQSYAGGLDMFEYRIPLCDADHSHDFCFTVPPYPDLPAAKLGFTVAYEPLGGVASLWPAGIGNPGGYAQFVLSYPPAPHLSITNANNAYLASANNELWLRGGINAQFTLVADGTDPSGITSATFPSAMDLGSGWDTGSNPTPTSFQYYAPSAPPPSGSYNVTLTNGAGLTGPPTSFFFGADSTQPTGGIDCQPLGCLNTHGPVRVTLSAADVGGSGIARLRYTLDGTDPGPDNGTSISPGGTISVTSPSTTVKLWGVDNVGNAGPIASAGVSGVPAPAALTWNYANDFQDRSNPGPDLYGNANVWSYGEVPVGTQHDAGTAKLYTQMWTLSGQRCWHSDILESLTPDDCVIPGGSPPATDVDPASTRDTFIRWTSPITGNVSITGGLRDADGNCGDGISWFLDQNGNSLVAGTIPNRGSDVFPSTLSSIPVVVGDTITLLVGPGPTTDYFCDSTAVDLTITQLASGTPPTIQSVEGATGIVGQADPVLQISYTDPECDVTGGTWDGAAGSGLTQDFTVAGGCSAGSGVATFTRACAWFGRWTEYITLVDATGQKSERFPFTYRCVAATSTAPNIRSVGGASGIVGGAPVPLSITFNDRECDVITGTWEGPFDSGLSQDFYTPQPTSCSDGIGTAPYVRAACLTAGESTEFITIVDSLGNRSQRFPYTLTCSSPDPPQTGPTFTVNTADDHNDTACTLSDCSLREALNAANNTEDAATIHFAILSYGLATIALGNPLPKAVVPITIDGTTEPGVLAGPGIALDGIEMTAPEGTPLDGIVLAAGSSTVRGLAFENFARNAIVITGDGVHIVGNVIGTTPDGTALQSNGGAGIVVNGAAGTQISGNLVSGSGAAGISVTGGATGTMIQGNKIGTGANGDPHGVGNLGAGIQIAVNSPNTHVGGVGSGEGNRIAANGGPGVLVGSSGNPILGNSIGRNGGGGISLGDTGNQLQAAPLIAFARVSGNSLNVIGKFLTPAGMYRLEYFLNTSCPEVGPKEGATFIGSSQVVVNGGGEAAVNATLDISDVSPNAGSLVTATATSASGNTSAFSNRCISLTRGGTATSATLSLYADTATTPPGASVIPLSAIPPSAFSKTSTDSNGGTVAAPLGAIPLGAIPLGAIPLGAIPLGAIPLGAIGFTPQSLVQDGLGGVPLNTIPLKAPLSWETELNGTPLKGVPAQTLTLKDVLGLPPAVLPANLVTPGPNAIGLKDIDLSLSPLGAIPLGAIALGSSPLGAIPIGGGTTTLANVADWCTQIKSLPGFGTFDCTGLGTQTVMGVAIQGVPLGAIPLGAIPLGAIPLGAIPLGAIPLGAIDLANSPLGAIPLGAITLADTPLGAIPLGAIPLGAIPLGAIPLGAIPLGAIPLLVDCTGTFSCAGKTLADAYAAGAVKSTAKLADLGTYGAATLRDLALYLKEHPGIDVKSVVPGLPGTVTLRDLLAALMGGTPPSWEQFPLGGLQDFAASGGLVTYNAGFTIAGSGSAAVATLGATMPAGARYAGGPVVLTDGTAHTTSSIGDPTITGASLSWTLDALAYGHDYTLAFKLRPGFQLGNEQAKVTLSTNGLADQSMTADVTVGDTFESNDTPIASPLISPSTLYISYLGNGKDIDYSKLHIDPISAPAGTRIKIFLSHLHSDADLAVFGPAETPLRSAPLGAIPLGAIAAGDQTVKLGQQSQQLTPDTAQDLPFGVLPVGNQLLGVSDNRGTGDEEVDITSTGQTGDLFIQVSSYDGHPTADPYVVRVQEDLPPALPPCTQLPPAGVGQTEATMPTISATTQTLILFNEKRLGQYYNTPTSDLAHTVYTKLQTYAARNDVHGAIIPVEANPGVTSAYTNWDANLCSPSAANGVVRAIGTLLDTLQAGHPNLKSIVVVGADHIIPFARLLDQTQQANELGFRSTFGFVNNEYVGAVAAGYLFSDDPYADQDPQSLLGGSLYVPKLALGRLVETPGDIGKQLDAYTARNGLVNPQTKLVTGYDFLTDGSQAVDSALGRTVPIPNLISDTWTANDVRGALFPLSGAAVIDSINAHYDQHRALSAQGNTLHDESPASLFTTTDVAAKGASGVLGRIVFTMGCHAGFSLFDGLSYFTSGQPTDFALDWPQAYMAGGAIEFMGNTGFGLGDTAAVAYSERLNQLFAQRLNGTMTIGEALQYAKQEYFGGLGVVSLYDAKVGNEATLYGIPTYRLGTGTPPAAPVSAPTHADSITGLTSLDFSVSPTFTLRSPTLPNGTVLGNYYSANDPNGLGTQVTNRRPIEPLTSLDVTEPNTTAHGVLVTGLVSHDVTGFHAAFGRVADDSSLIEPQLQGIVDFPASIQSLATIATPNGQRQRAILIAGHFASGASPGVGKQRLYDTLGGTVLYSASADFVRPTIRNVQVLQVGSTVGFEADVTDLDAAGAAGTVKEAIVLYLDGSGLWNRANLICASGHCTGGGPLTGSNVDYMVEAVDAAGNVGVNANKAAATNVTPPAGSQHIIVSFGTATTSAGWYTTAVTVALSSYDGVSLTHSLDGGPFVGGTPVAVTGDGLHTLDVRGSDGSVATVAIPIDTTAPTIAIVTPANGSYVLAGSAVKALYSCSDSGSGLAAPTATNGCVGTVAVGANIDTTATPATKTFTVTAKDAANHSSQLTVSYRVWKSVGDSIVALADKTVLYLKGTPLSTALKAMLTDAANTFVAKNKPAACAALNLYIAAVKLAPATKLTAVQKDDLVADATRIKVFIGCS